MEHENRIGAAWAEYSKAVFPPDVSRIQYEESRKCFYGGFSACMRIMSEDVGGCDKEQDGLAIIAGLSREMLEHCDVVARAAGIRK